LAASFAAVANVEKSKHNLSVTGPGSIVAVSETEICRFCHTPHAGTATLPLWNHADSATEPYAAYSSSTLSLTTPIEQPTGASKLCLSCHDGTVALGQTVNDGLIALLNVGPSGRMPAGLSKTGTDLTDDHPISFTPNLENPQIILPPPEDSVAMDAAGELQCTTCHDPHREDRDPVTRKFLVKSNRGSDLCITCHKMTRWAGSAHQSSPAPFTRAQGAHTGYATMADNGCAACHRSHSGKQPERLLKEIEEKTCLRCHDGSVAATNIAAEYAKAYGHPTLSKTPSAHNAAERPQHPTTPMPEISPAAERHAECSDCHNGHAARPAFSVGQGLPGPLEGTWGIDSDGLERAEAQAEYEICYKCHGDSANEPQRAGAPNPPYAQRRNVQFNVREEFDPLNPSHHAVEAPGRSLDVPSLLPGYSTASTITCTDCHNNDSGPGAGGSGPRGPHGSRHQYLLERNMRGGSGNGNAGLGGMYALCFKCHDQSSILADESFSEHGKHIRGAGTSCLVCHDPHGVSAMQGNSTNNSHLINFETRVVKANGAGDLRFEDRGDRTGACYLKCHGVDHDPFEY
jgi:predicted CXXCH cytochrome family protein